jgi:hypothetical protein
MNWSIALVFVMVVVMPTTVVMRSVPVMIECSHLYCIVIFKITIKLVINHYRLTLGNKRKVRLVNLHISYLALALV